MRLRRIMQSLLRRERYTVDTWSLREDRSKWLGLLVPIESFILALPADVRQNEFEGWDCPRRRNLSQLKQTSSGSQRYSTIYKCWIIFYIYRWLNWLNTKNRPWQVKKKTLTPLSPNHMGTIILRLCSGSVIPTHFSVNHPNLNFSIGPILCPAVI